MSSQAFLRALVLLITGFTAFAGEPRRFIVVGFEVDRLKADVARENGAVLHELQYHQGFIAHLSSDSADRLQRKYGPFALIEEDGEVHAIGKLAAQPIRLSAKSAPAPAPQPAQVTPWGVTAVKAPSAYAITRGAGVTVCVVDTGIQGDHPDLAANVVGGQNFVWMRGSVNPSAWADDNGHGTHVSGTIAALDNGIGVVGVAPEAKLFAAKVLDSRGSGYNSAIADGVRACIAKGAKVINMSLGGPSDSLVLHSAITDAYNAGVTLVAAAGNESLDAMTSYPAAYPEVVAVSAVDSNLRFASFSNFGAKIAFAAPGVSVRSTVKGGTYATYNGTSMASPHVAGVAALKLSSGSLGLLGTDIGLPASQQGAGLINALSTVQNQPVATP